MTLNVAARESIRFLYQYGVARPFLVFAAIVIALLFSSGAGDPFQGVVRLFVLPGTEFVRTSNPDVFVTTGCLDKDADRARSLETSPEQRLQCQHRGEKQVTLEDMTAFAKHWALFMYVLCVALGSAWGLLSDIAKTVSEKQNRELLATYIRKHVFRRGS
ncbi:hypothetical protein [Paraburkholderia tropica]|uniref:hypothetical protein n=1 Tax=Paraburkholderia tropica TaxID=92647 RepID=UPI002AB5E840|nr:hypothetical protein [Paraburkholderia tropica]